MFRSGALVMSLLMATTSIASANGPIDTIEVGNWSGGSYTNDRTGEFDHCAASAKYVNGQYLIASIGANGNWSLGILDPRWDLRLRSEYTAQIYFDGVGPFRLTGHAIDTNLVEIPMPDSGVAVEAFREAAGMNINLGGKNFRYDLTSTYELLPALKDCVVEALRQADNDRSSDGGSATADSNADPQRDKLLSDVAAKYSDCILARMKEVVPYSDESADLLAGVITTSCEPIVEHFVDLGATLFHASKAQIENVVEGAVAKRKQEIVAEIVTFRAEVHKQQIETSKKNQTGL